MAVFITLAVLLCFFVLTLLLRPMWRQARGVALGIGIIALCSTALLYRLVGTPQALNPALRQAPQTLEEAIVQLKAALERDPLQAEGWVLLGQAYQRQGNAAAATDAISKAAKLAPENPEILTSAAQARALADSNHVFDAQALAWLNAALKADPNHQRARWFLGVAQRQAGKNSEAAATWEPLLTIVDKPTAASLLHEINTARSEAGLPPLAEPAAAATLASVEVTIDPALLKTLPPTASVFVIAHQVGGSPMPVAAKKLALTDLPLQAELSDDDSPMPTLKLSQMKEVELVARISQSGEANKQTGDIESKPVRVALPATKTVVLRIW